jgi:hypothetical protein
MYSLIKNGIYQNRLVSIILLCALTVLISLLYFSLTQPRVILQEPPVHQQTAAKTTVPGIPTFTPSETQTYTNPTYSMSFPHSWSEDTNTAADTQGKLLSLKPDAQDPLENAQVAVEINSTQDTSLAKIRAGLTFLGLKNSFTSVQGIPAQKFTGTVTLSQKILHNTIYLFSYKEQIYLIKLSYQGEKYDAQLEQEFIQSVNTFSFN